MIVSRSCKAPRIVCQADRVPRKRDCTFSLRNACNIGTAASRGLFLTYVSRSGSDHVFSHQQQSCCRKSLSRQWGRTASSTPSRCCATQPQAAFPEGRSDQSTINADLISLLLHSLKGVAQACDASKIMAESASRHISSVQPVSLNTDVAPLSTWLRELLQRSTIEDQAAHLVRLAVTITYTRHRCQHAPVSGNLNAEDLKTVWDVLLAAMLSPLYAQKRAVRSHQGFLSVPICDLRKPNGENEELWRIHLWLPNRPQSDPDFIMHSHKSFAQSWILAGEGKNGEYTARSVQDKADATHAIYEVADQRTITHRQLSMIVLNTGKLMRVHSTRFETHTRDMSYVVPEATFHTSQVPLEQVHATIFFFDASRGYSNDGGVSLGPKNLDKVQQNRDPGFFTAPFLASVIDAVRKWELALEKALSFAKTNKWQEAKEVFESMVTAWEPLPNGALRVELSSPANDLRSLNRYLMIAQRLMSWADHVFKGRQLFANADPGNANAEFDLARRESQMLPDDAIIKQCDALLSRYPQALSGLNNPRR